MKPNFILTALLTLTAVSNAHAQAYAPEFTIPAPFMITITDSTGAPIASAHVLIGEAANIPFNGNELVTDISGQVALPQNWLTEEPVTIEAAGFIPATFLAMQPQIATLQLRREVISTAAPARFELKGNTSGFGTLKNDGTFDIGLVVQAVPRSALSSISLQSLISPEVDHFTVLGQSVDLPSNITLPEQTESYIFPLKFNKPAYRMYLPNGGQWNIASLHARVPFKSTVDALQKGKTMVDIIDTCDFVEGSIDAITLTLPSTTQDYVVNKMPFAKSIAFKAPSYDPGLNLLAISMANLNGTYYPTDIKNVPSNGAVNLAAPAGATTTGMVLAAYKKAGTKTVGAQADQYSAVTLPNNENRPFDPIRLVESPRVNQNQLVLDTPTASANLDPVMTYGVLSVVTSISQGKLQIETKSPQWDVWAPKWVTKLDLPQRALPPLGANQSLRWEVGFSAQFLGQKATPPGPGSLEKITHVSRSAVDL